MNHGRRRPKGASQRLPASGLRFRVYGVMGLMGFRVYGVYGSRGFRVSGVLGLEFIGLGC